MWLILLNSTFLCNLCSWLKVPVMRENQKVLCHLSHSLEWILVEFDVLVRQSDEPQNHFILFDRPSPPPPPSPTKKKKHPLTLRWLAFRCLQINSFKHGKMTQLNSVAWCQFEWPWPSFKVAAMWERRNFLTRFLPISLSIWLKKNMVCCHGLLSCSNSC